MEVKSKLERIPRTNHFMHLFAGCRSLDREFWRKSLVGISYDVTLSSSKMDILTPIGKALVLLGLLTVVPAGLICGGPVCTSWVFICRHSTERTREKQQGLRKKHRSGARWE
eukprot:4434111-Pyramimonas_sp.AAC.1